MYIYIHTIHTHTYTLTYICLKNRFQKAFLGFGVEALSSTDSSLFSVAATSLHKDTETQEPLFKCSPSTFWPQVGSILVLAFEAAFDKGIRVFRLPAITCCCWPLPSFWNFVSISISLVWRLGMGICIFKTLVPTAVCCCTVAGFYLSYVSSCVSRSELSKLSAGVWPLDPHILVT